MGRNQGSPRTDPQERWEHATDQNFQNPARKCPEQVFICPLHGILSPWPGATGQAGTPILHPQSPSSIISILWYLIKTAVCRRACTSGLSPACWVGQCTWPGVLPSRCDSGIVSWHTARRVPSTAPHLSPGDSTASQCSSSVHCPRGRGTAPGPGYWHHTCDHGRFGSLRGWMWSDPSPGRPGSISKCGVGSLQTQNTPSWHCGVREAGLPPPINPPAGSTAC